MYVLLQQLMLNDTHLYNFLSPFHVISAQLQSVATVSLLCFVPNCHLRDVKMKYSISFGDKW